MCRDISCREVCDAANDARAEDDKPIAEADIDEPDEDEIAEPDCLDTVAERRKRRWERWDNG